MSKDKFNYNAISERNHAHHTIETYFGVDPDALLMKAEGDLEKGGHYTSDSSGTERYSNEEMDEIYGKDWDKDIKKSDDKVVEKALQKAKKAMGTENSPGARETLEKGGKGSGRKIGSTKSGKDIYSHKSPSDYKDFNKQDHLDAHLAHKKVANNTKDTNEFVHHVGKMNKHKAFSITGGPQVEKSGNDTMTDDPDSFMKGKKETPEQAKEHKVMHEFKEGELHSGSKKGPEVKSRKQAEAIAISEAKNDVNKGGVGSGKYEHTTKSGKKYDLRSKRNHKNHENFTKEDHLEVAKKHREFLKENSGMLNGEVLGHHSGSAHFHEEQAKNLKKSEALKILGVE